MRRFSLFLFVFASLLRIPALQADAFDREAAIARATARLVEMHGAGAVARASRGVQQAAGMWRDEDGDADAFVAFVAEHFLTDEQELADTFAHLEYAMEMMDGHLVSLNRELRHYMDEDVGLIRPVDRLLGAFNPFAHVTEDLFATKIGFVTLLNFPASTLEERLEVGESWSRRRWAEARLVARFEDRVPADVQQALSEATATADEYVNDYNLYLHHWLTEDGRRLFPEGLRLISHWGLRDELKSHYVGDNGLEKQRMIAHVMEQIVRQDIPAAVVNNPLIDWTPTTGALAVSDVRDVAAPPGAQDRVDAAREPDTRYKLLLDIFQAMRKVDPYVPTAPTAIARSFDVGREIPADVVRRMFEDLFRAPVARDVARLIESRLGREIEPFDIWYAGFKPRAALEEAELDAITKQRYPTPEVFERDIPRILGDLGFERPQVELLAAHVVVDPSRGAGHAWGAARRDDAAHLRTRVGSDGMDYKGYNIAIHELGHNVEQVFSLNAIDHTLLAGVPGNAFTEALAFVFQERDLELLGVSKSHEDAKHLHALEAFWNSCEIGAVALVDLAVWEWMYAHPDATPAQLREATIRIASDVWRDTFAPLTHDKPSVLLAIYSHMLAYPLYLANYPLGHIIAFQLEQHFRDADLAREFERVCRLGNLTPDLWMRQAVGAPLSAQPLIEATQRAVAALGLESSAQADQ